MIHGNDDKSHIRRCHRPEEHSIIFFLVSELPYSYYEYDDDDDDDMMMWSKWLIGFLLN